MDHRHILCIGNIPLISYSASVRHCCVGKQNNTSIANFPVAIRHFCLYHGLFHDCCIDTDDRKTSKSQYKDKSGNNFFHTILLSIVSLSIIF